MKPGPPRRVVLLQPPARFPLRLLLLLLKPQPPALGDKKEGGEDRGEAPAGRNSATYRPSSLVKTINVQFKSALCGYLDTPVFQGLGLGWVSKFQPRAQS